MSKPEGIIFDMDGCLYPLDGGEGTTFKRSRFGKQILDNIARFFGDTFDLTFEEACIAATELGERHDGEISLGLEREHNIPRAKFFGATWDLDPADFMIPNPLLVASLEEVTAERALLSAAPDIWVERTLGYLGVRELFGSAIFTGEPDVRKPQPEAFLQIARHWNMEPSHILAIGDQEATDILPPQQLGMQTLRIGSDPESRADMMAPNIQSAFRLLRERNLL